MRIPDEKLAEVFDRGFTVVEGFLDCSHPVAEDRPHSRAQTEFGCQRSDVGDAFGIHVAEHRLRAKIDRRIGSRAPRQAGTDDLIPFSNSFQQERQIKGGGAGVHSHNVGHVKRSSQLFLEGKSFRSHPDLSAARTRP